MMNPPPPNKDELNGDTGGWSEYRRLVVRSLERHDAEIDAISKQFDRLEKKLDTMMRELKEDFVTRKEFLPLRLAIYGIIGLGGTVLAAVFLRVVPILPPAIPG